MNKTSGKRKSEIDPSHSIGKRIKVHAQRKFAQGAAIFPTSQRDFTTPSENSKETSKDSTFKLQTENKSSTEDFLTYLCFKGCPSYNIVEPHLAPKEPVKYSPPPEPLTTSMGDVKGFIPFGVRKQASQHPVKNTLLIEAMKSNRRDLKSEMMKRKIKISKLNKNSNSDATKQMQTRSSTTHFKNKNRNRGKIKRPIQNGASKVQNKGPSPKMAKPSVKKSETTSSISFATNGVSLRNRVVQFNNKLALKKVKDINKNESVNEQHQSSIQETDGEHTPPHSKTLSLKLEDAMKSPDEKRLTRSNMLQNTKYSLNKLTLKTRSATSMQVSKSITRGIQNIRTKRSKNTIEKDKANELKANKPNEVAEFSSDDDEPLLKKLDSDLATVDVAIQLKPFVSDLIPTASEQKTEPVTTTSSRVTRSKNISNPKNYMQMSVNDNQQQPSCSKSINPPADINSEVEVEKTILTNLNKGDTSDSELDMIHVTTDSDRLQVPPVHPDPRTLIIKSINTDNDDDKKPLVSQSNKSGNLCRAKNVRVSSSFYYRNLAISDDDNDDDSGRLDAHQSNDVRHQKMSSASDLRNLGTSNNDGRSQVRRSNNIRKSRNMRMSSTSDNRNTIISDVDGRPQVRRSNKVRNNLRKSRNSRMSSESDHRSEAISDNDRRPQTGQLNKLRKSRNPRITYNNRNTLISDNDRRPQLRRLNNVRNIRSSRKSKISTPCIRELSITDSDDVKRSRIRPSNNVRNNLKQKNARVSSLSSANLSISDSNDEERSRVRQSNNTRNYLGSRKVRMSSAPDHRNFALPKDGRGLLVHQSNNLENNPSVSNVEGSSNNRGRMFIIPIKPINLNSKTKLLETRRFAKNINATDLDTSVLTESIKNMLRERTAQQIISTPIVRLARNRSEFTDSDEEPLAAKIQDSSTKTSLLRTNSSTPRPSTSRRRILQTPDITKNGNKITQKMSEDREQRNQVVVNSNTNNHEENTIENNPDTVRVNNIDIIIEDKSIDNTENNSENNTNNNTDNTMKMNIEENTDYNADNVPTGEESNGLDSNDDRLKGDFVALTKGNVTRIADKGKRLFKTKEYIEFWIEECAKAFNFKTLEDYVDGPLYEIPVDPCIINPVYPLTSMIADIDSRLKKTYVGPQTAPATSVDVKVKVESAANENIVNVIPNNRPEPGENQRERLNENTQEDMKQLLGEIFRGPNNVATENIYDFESDSEIILPPRMIKEGEWKSIKPREAQSEMKKLLSYDPLRQSLEWSLDSILPNCDPDSKSRDIEIMDPPINMNVDIPTPSQGIPEPTVSNNQLVEDLIISENRLLSDSQIPVSDVLKNAEGHLFYLPIQGLTKDGKSVDHVIEGVAVKRDTNGPGGQKEKIIMKAKLLMNSDMKLQPSTTTNKPTINLPEINTKTIEQKHFDKPLVKKVIPTASVPPLNTKPFISAVGKTLENQSSSGNAPGPSNINSAPQSNINNVNSPGVSNVSSPGPSTSKGYTTTTRAINSGTRRASSVRPINCINVSTFPQTGDPTEMVNAPIFYPSEKDFVDPLEYIERITPTAAKYGLCKIIPPPCFKSECKISDDMRFTPHNQYLQRMFFRWGESSREMCAIKKYLGTQNVPFKHPPLLCGIEVDLPKMYHVVQNMGGLKRVIEKKMWTKVADEMCLPTNGHYMDSKLYEIYIKYLLPYDTLDNLEREKLFKCIDQEWEKRQNEMANKDSNKADNSSELDTSVAAEQEYLKEILEDVEECITRGKSLSLSAFSRVAKNMMYMQFKKEIAPPSDVVEAKFWDHVSKRTDHVCVNTGSIDSSVWGFGFPNTKTKNCPLSKHPWNLKVLTNNSGSVLRSLGPIMGVTVPTLHVGMVFSTCCWYRDPHGLPWIEYLHEGSSKIWYGVPDSQSKKFKDALTSLVPGYCQQKTVWLLSDTTMVPPAVLTEHGVSLCRVVQNPGEFILVFPKAFTSSICTGFTVSESVYFAPNSWLETANQDFMDIHNSCEPSMFSLERLVVSISEDVRSSHIVLQQVLPILNKIVQNEKQNRDAIYNIGIKQTERTALTGTGKKKVPKPQDDGEECHHCRTSLSLSMLHNPEDGSMFCLAHGVEYLKTNKKQMLHCKLIYTHTIAELEKLEEKLMERITLRGNRRNARAK